MTPLRRLARLAAPIGVLWASTAFAAPPPPGRAELIVRNESFSTLAIALVLDGGREVDLGQAPPEFTNTLYFSVEPRPIQVRFRARLRGSDEVLFESDLVRARAMEHDSAGPCPRTSSRPSGRDRGGSMGIPDRLA